MTDTEHELRRLERRCNELWHALGCVLRYSVKPDDLQSDGLLAIDWAIGVFSGDASVADAAAQAALELYAIKAFECPIGTPGCTKNCGSYGCGN